ncbi:unnamed protein product, partial [Cladocopium goreaui]
MRQVRPVAQGEEIFNTYGPLPSAQLFSSFGFAGDRLNPYDGRNCFNLAQRYLKAQERKGPRCLLAARCGARSTRRQGCQGPPLPCHIQKARRAVRQARAKLGDQTPRTGALQAYRAAERRCLQHAARHDLESTDFSSSWILLYSLGLYPVESALTRMLSQRRLLPSRAKMRAKKERKR